MPTQYGVVGYVEYGDFSRSIFKIDPESFGGALPINGDPNGQTSNTGELINSKRESMVIVGKEDGAFAIRSVNANERERVAEVIDTDQFKAFTHSDTDKIIAVSEDAVPDEHRIAVYQLATNQSDPISNECKIISIDKGVVMNKGGIAPNDDAKIIDGPVAVAQEKDCPDELGYCAVSGYLCIQQAYLCYFCGSVCALSAIVWPAVAACIACLLVLCGTAVLPQVGSCGTALDCLLDIGSDIPGVGNIELPDWYQNSDFACR